MLPKLCKLQCNRRHRTKSRKEKATKPQSLPSHWNRIGLDSPPDTTEIEDDGIIVDGDEVLGEGLVVEEEPSKNRRKPNEGHSTIALQSSICAQRD